jgi:hypothetical protein
MQSPDCPKIGAGVVVLDEGGLDPQLPPRLDAERFDEEAALIAEYIRFHQNQPVELRFKANGQS